MEARPSELAERCSAVSGGGCLRSAAPEAAETAGCAGFRPVGVGTALVYWIFREQASGGMCRPDRPQARIRDTRSL